MGVKGCLLGQAVSRDALCDQVMGCLLSCLSHRGPWHLRATRDGNQTILWLLLVQRTPVMCVGIGLAFPGLSLGSDYRILCAPHFGGDINSLLAELSPVPAE